MIWILTNASKKAPVRIVYFILTILKNEQCPCKHMIKDEYGTLEKSTDVTDPRDDEFNISL